MGRTSKGNDSSGALSHYLCRVVVYSGVLVVVLFSSALPVSVAQTQVCQYYQNQTVSSSQTTEVKVTVYVNSNAVSGSGYSTTLSSQDIEDVIFVTTLSSLSSPDISVKRAVDIINSTSSPPVIRLITSLTDTSSSTSSGLTNVVFEEDISNGLQAFWTSTFLPGFSSPNVTISGREYVQYRRHSTLLPGENDTMQFEAEPSGDQGTDLQSGIHHFYSSLTFQDQSTSTTFGPFSLSLCLDVDLLVETSVFYQHGFTALTFFMALLVGFVLVALAVVLYLVCGRRYKGSRVSPTHSEEHRMKEKGKKIVMDPKAALRKGLNIIKDYSMIAWNESIILILSLKDKLHMFREIDNLDVLATIHLDTELEQEQNEASVQATQLLIRGLRHNQDISVQTEEVAMGAFRSGMKDLDKRLEAEYRQELEVVYTDLSAKNKEKLAELLQKHRKQKQETTEATKELSEKERESLMKLINRQHEMEDGELTFTLALEQNEAAEKLRKEFAIRKRMGIKELQQNVIAEVNSRGQLDAEKADWLRKEYKRQQEAVHRMYDDEISRQRMALEEKLARRRGLAQMSETQEDDHTDLLNLQAAHIVSFLNKGRRSSVVTGEQSEEWIEELKAQALNIKTHMESAKESQEAELHKELSQAKVTQLGELIKKHKTEILEFENKKDSKQSESEEPVDPVSYVEGQLKLRSQHRLEVANLENQLDADHAQKLSALRQELAQQAQDKMDLVLEDTRQRMTSEGMTEKTVAALMKKHQEETQNLLQTQQKNRQRQENNLKEELARRRREAAKRREMERQEQEELRQHEAEIVEKLVNSQLSMSEAERDRVMKEHEKQMVLLENSLTLNKLRQQRSLEERLKQKRAQQMAVLQAQQRTELTKQRKASARNRRPDDDDDEEGEDEASHRASVQMMKRHAQQRLAVLQGQQLNIDEELEQIRIEMQKGRALALKNQEERLGAMIAALQMEKAREMTQIEEQQKAINNLKANIMDDLNERGILSTPECDLILDTHKQDTKALHQRMETQREKQEKILRTRLEQRMQQRERVLLTQHEGEMRKLMAGKSGSKFAAKVRRMMLVHKHLVTMEKLRNRLDREISQTLAHTRQQFEVVKLKKLQEEELAFVAGLVRVGRFNQSELLDVLHMLFPSKTEDDIQQLLARITEGAEKESKHSGKSTIVERIYQALFVRPSRFFRSISAQSKARSAKPKMPIKRDSSTRSLLNSTTIGTTASIPTGDSPNPTGGPFPSTSATTANRTPGNQNSQSAEVVGRKAQAGGGYDPAGSPASGSADYGGGEGGMDFIAMGASMSFGGEGGGGSPARAMHLPPLEDDGEMSPRRARKKKKKGLKGLKKEGDGDV
ncbi:limbin-like [Babylonia areolata]|uniref:limbin-like n=1 Tax=Babylonia areolata TaxID=304850 RepID=UPI003FD06C6B